jgi:aryl-alcohol dehydrogenase-like predicted oxidoreductase
VAALRLALDGGLTHIDTADVYGYGRSERLVAKALTSSAKTTTIATKVGWAATTAPSVFSPENIRFQFEQSLRNLGLSTIDIYYAHHTDFGPDDMFLAAAAAEFHRLKSEGLIRSIGLSGYSEGGLIRVASQLQPDFIQSWASIEHPEFIREGGPLARFMEERSIRFVAMMPLGQGRLLGKFHSANPPQFEAGDNRLGNFEFSSESLAEFEGKLGALQARFGETTRELITPALGFVLKHPSVISVIPGFRSSKQVLEMLAAIERPYSDEDHEFVQATFPYSESHLHPWVSRTSLC